MKAPDKIFVPTRFGLVDALRVRENDTDEEYICKDALMEWIKSEMERLWELLPDADNPDHTQMELRYLGQYMQMEALEDKLNEM